MGEAASIAQTILGRQSGTGIPAVGSIVFARVDRVMCTDGVYGVLRQVERMTEHPAALDRLCAVSDHHVPANTVDAANTARLGRECAKRMGVTLVDVGRGGIGHHVLPERGLVRPGQLIIGADSHSCTYGAFSAFATGIGGSDAACALATGRLWFTVPDAIRVVITGRKQPFVQGKDIVLSLLARLGVDGAAWCSLEFDGPALAELTIADRVTICNMVVEMGAKCGIFPFDEVTDRYFRDTHGYVTPEDMRVRIGADAAYSRTIHLDLDALEPMVAVPDLPCNVRPARELRGVAVQQALLGSCTNGRIEDMRLAAQVMRGRAVHPDTRMIVLPGTQKILLQMAKEGLYQAFIEAGAIMGPPTCGPCAGVHMGILGDGERCISSTNRNFVGRMGSPKAEVYLASPAVVAASAVAGFICHPQEVPDA